MTSKATAGVRDGLDPGERIEPETCRDRSSSTCASERSLALGSRRDDGPHVSPVQWPSGANISHIR
jgi:hypothetical protein